MTERTAFPKTRVLTAHALRIAAILLLTVSPLSAASYVCLRGVNIAGAEFGGYDDAYGQKYIYPSDATLDWAAQIGMSAIRLPFQWERLQRDLFSTFNTAELNRLADTVERANQRGLTVILDVHNYASYKGVSIGLQEVTAAAFADFWRRLATRFANNPNVVFGLMNEPAGIDVQPWFDAAQQSIVAIRETGAENLVLVPGTIWTGASHWFAVQDGGSNATVFDGFQDPIDNFAFEFHQYLDKDFSGTNETCPRTQDALLALHGVSGWMRQHGYRGFLGEFGGTHSPDCLSGLVEMVQLINSQDDIWIGWTAWAAGDWWGDYPLSLQPEAGVEKPQMKALQPLLLSADGNAPACRSLEGR